MPPAPKGATISYGPSLAPGGRATRAPLWSGDNALKGVGGLWMDGRHILALTMLFHLSRCIFFSSDDADRFLKLASAAVVRCQPWFYLRLVAYCFFGLSERA